nr:glycosyltransferase [uncultured Campylobacter sp.]
MKILHTLQWKQFAGTEKVCVDLCNEMAKTNEVFLLSDEKIAPYLSERVNLIKFNFEHNRYNPLFLLQTAQLLIKISPDIIHCHNTKEIEIMYRARNLARFLGSRRIGVVATKHTLQVKKNYKLADLCVAVLEDTKEILPTNSIIIKNAMAYKKPKEGEYRSNKFSIISAARLSAPKGMDIIIKALADVNFDFECTIFGSGEEEENLKDLIKELGLEEKINIAGFTDHLQDYLSACNLQIIASAFEAYGLTAIDGVYYSPLLISTAVGICTEILPKELLFERDILSLRRKLNEVYENYEEFKAIFSKVKEKCKGEFDMSNVVNQYIRAYKSLI